MRDIIITRAGGLVGLNLLSVIKDKHKAIIAIDKNLKRIKLIIISLLLLDIRENR